MYRKVFTHESHCCSGYGGVTFRATKAPDGSYNSYREAQWYQIELNIFGGTVSFRQIGNNTVKALYSTTQVEFDWLMLITIKIDAFYNKLNDSSIYNIYINDYLIFSHIETSKYNYGSIGVTTRWEDAMFLRVSMTDTTNTTSNSYNNIYVNDCENIDGGGWQLVSSIYWICGPMVPSAQPIQFVVIASRGLD